MLKDPNKIHRKAMSSLIPRQSGLMSVGHPAFQVSERNAKKVQLVKKAGRLQRTSVKLPNAIAKSRAFPPAILTALIGEDAANKLAANEPFALHIHRDASEYLILYVGNHVPPRAAGCVSSMPKQSISRKLKRVP
jgi:hypothetical protein